MGCNKCLSCKCGKRGVQRWWGNILAMLTIAISFAIRISTHLTIVVMVVNTTKPKCVAPRSIGRSKIAKDDINKWSEPIQAWIIAAFYIGYTVFYLPFDILVRKCGARWILSSSFLVCVICTFLIHVSVRYIGFEAMIVLRLLEGVAQAVLFPAVQVYLGSWTVHNERPDASATIFAGAPIGSIAGLLISGFLIYIFNTWKAVYYAWACLGSILYILLIIYLYSDPTTHRHISKKELAFVYLNTVPKTTKKPKAPYIKILRDWAVIATIIAEIGYVTIWFFFINNFPKFMNNVISYPLIDNAVVSSIPYIAPLMVSIPAGRLADWGIEVKNWDIGFTRKCFCVAAMLASFFLLGVGYCTCDDVLVIMFLVFAMLCLGFHFPGLRLNAIDLTTQHARFVAALPHGIGGIIGIVQPLAIAHLAPNNVQKEWILIFWIFCAIAVLSTVVFFVMGSGKRRRWDYHKSARKYFKTKVPRFSIFDGKDKDKEAARIGPQQDQYNDMLEYRNRILR